MAGELIFREVTNGFLAALCNGETLQNPVLLVVGEETASQAGSQKALLRVADGSFTMKYPVDSTVYYYGNLFVVSKNIILGSSCVGKLVQLRHYTVVNISTRKYPVATDLEILSTSYDIHSLSFILHPTCHAIPSSSSEAVSPHSREIVSTVSTPQKRLLSSEGGNTFSSPRKEARHTGAPPFQFSATGPVARQSEGLKTRISSLNPFSSHWMIKARVSTKSEIHIFSNPRGEGKLFNIHLIDSESIEIRATFFGRAVDKWYTQLIEGNDDAYENCFLFHVRKYNPLPHMYELCFDENAQIVPLANDESIPQKTFSFEKISTVMELETSTVVDLVAILVDSSDLMNIIIKSSGKEKPKRDFTLVDPTGTIVFTLWGESQNEKIPLSLMSTHPVLAIKGAKVGDFMHKKLDSTSTTDLQWNPPILEAEALIDWWKIQSAGKMFISSPGRSSVSEISNMKSIQEIIQESTSASSSKQEYSGYFSTLCTIDWIFPEKFYWIGCPHCKRKIIIIENDGPDKPLGVSESTEAMGFKFCTACRRDCVPVFNWLLSLRISDWSGSLRCMALAEQGQELMKTLDVDLKGMVLRERMHSLDSYGRSNKDIFEELKFTEWKLRISSRYETFNDEKVLKYKVVGSTRRIDLMINEIASSHLKYLAT
ncbi:hypothetical protein IE077_003739 [Cardiosporidium cionae]|uniref:Replication protein A subunit n=1 Tax=Cardiosporidium cionae TaxID=476202 RepID=A0ABQ7JEQ6_9APIC|nr:hypothetical protein IE077_003739 [Cardiosporidium cionae]|eukprot:KAF8822439.1 hypothetical protein IE077_003739 [Cardiosporidium cionae]